MSHFIHHKFIAPNFSGALSIQAKYPQILIGNQMERAISVRSDRNIWDNLWRWFTLTSPLISVGPTESPFHLTKLLSPVPLFCILLAAGTISKHPVAWNGSVKPEWTVPLGTWNFWIFKPKFLLNGKRRGTGVSFSNSQYQGLLVPRDFLQKSTGEEVVHMSA